MKRIFNFVKSGELRDISLRRGLNEISVRVLSKAKKIGEYQLFKSCRVQKLEGAHAFVTEIAYACVYNHSGECVRGKHTMRILYSITI